MSENMTKSFGSRVLPPHTAARLGHEEIVEQPSLEIVGVPEKCRDEPQCAIVGTGNIHSAAEGMRSQDGTQKKERQRRTSTGLSPWNKVVKRFKSKTKDNLDSISKRSVEIYGRPREVPERPLGWMQILRNLFRPRSKKPTHQKGSEMSTFGLNYHVLEEDDSLPLVEHSPFHRGDSAAASHSELLVFHPLNSYTKPPPWILRKWKLRDSQEVLRISPATNELLFHYDTNQQYKCSIKLANMTKNYVAFKFKSTSPKGYLMMPKHGVLAPSTAIEVKGLHIGDPFSSSASQNDLFVVVTLQIPDQDSLMKAKPSTISTSIFKRFQDQCCCERVFHAVFTLRSSSSNVEKNAGENANLSYRTLSLTSIPEE